MFLNENVLSKNMKVNGRKRCLYNIGSINVSNTDNHVLSLSDSKPFSCLYLEKASDYSIQDIPLSFATNTDATNKKMSRSSLL